MRLFTNRKYPITFAAVDADGNPAPIDGAAHFALDPAEAGTLRAPDPSIADEAGFDANLTQILVINTQFVEANGTPTGVVTATITVTADADRTDGERDIVASGAFEFALPEATAGTVTVGDGLPLDPPPSP